MKLDTEIEQRFGGFIAWLKATDRPDFPKDFYKERLFYMFLDDYAGMAEKQRNAEAIIHMLTPEQLDKMAKEKRESAEVEKSKRG